MRVVLDGNEANVGNRVGSNVYAFELLVAFEKLLRTEKTVSVVVLLSAEKLPDLPKQRDGWEYRVVKPQFLWTQLAASAYLWLHKNEFDVYFTPGHYAPRFCPIPYVSSVMDVAYEKFPQQFKKKDLYQLKNWTKYSVKNADKVVAISNSTARDVELVYKKNREDIAVLYPALPVQEPLPAQNQLLKIRKKIGITSPYFLYVGTLQPRKNIEQCITAFEEVCRQLGSKKTGTFGPDLQLVLAGKTGWLAEPILNRIQCSEYADNILVTGYISQKQKQALYVGAIGTLNIGLYEGFGIPSLESIYYGTIPIVSNTSSLPEVVGPAGVLVNPLSSKEVVVAMLELTQLSAKDRKIFRSRMRKQVEKFSWTRSAEQLLAVLRSISPV